MKDVHVLVTLDVHDEDGVPESVLLAGRKLNELGVNATFFYTACVIEKTRNPQILLEQGHEIGSHGLYHKGADEHYNTMPTQKQQEYLERSTEIIEKGSGFRPVTFRAPVYKISGDALRILDSLGYVADVSVNSRRLGLFGSEPLNFSWLTAPVMPYHPSSDSPFKKGNLKIWEIPVSAFFVPFVTAFGQLFGTSALKLFFYQLYQESLRTGKPIVYGCHPEEFNPDRKPIRFIEGKFSLREFLPTSTRGVDLRYRFFQYNPRKLYEMTVELFEYMSRFPRVKFMTVKNYAADL
ncbi:MAG: polysaccharide deacetylase family protein [Planctomycetes bacterium]|nr:polysaccharide deacetylase family protein [Planctomycetota bacterium]